ncbi:hypothetical protein FDZ71_04540, partial [bacterium]
MRVPFYLAFADNADLTLTTNFQEKIGWSESAKLRYILAENHRGEAEIKILKGFDSEGAEAEIRADHISRFVGDATLDILADYVTDKARYKELGDTLEERSTLLKKSYIYFSDSTGYGSLFGLGRWTESFNTPQDETLQQLPSLGLWGKEYALWGPFYGLTDAVFDNFTREVGVKGERLRLSQGFAISRAVGSVGSKAMGGLKANLYRSGGEEYEETAPWALAEVSHSSLGYLGAADILLTPSLSWNFQGEGEDSQAPYFDANDDFSKKSRITPKLESLALLGGRDLIHLSVQKPLDLLSVTDGEINKNDWLPLKGEVGIWPLERLEIFGDGEHE